MFNNLATIVCFIVREKKFTVHKTVLKFFIKEDVIALCTTQTEYEIANMKK